LVHPFDLLGPRVWTQIVINNGECARCNKLEETVKMSFWSPPLSRAPLRSTILYLTCMYKTLTPTFRVRHGGWRFQRTARNDLNPSPALHTKRLFRLCR